VSAYIMDCETDGLLEEATKVHVISFSPLERLEPKSLSTYSDMKTFLQSAKTLVIHNGARFDIPVLEKILGIKVKSKLYDTLPMSWVINTDRNSHGLESFGEDFKVPKPVVTDWEGLTYEEYKHRCEEDVKINWLLWQDLIKRYKLIYSNDKESMDRFFQYLTFKMKCAAMAEQAGWKIDKELVQKSLAQLEKAQQEKVEELRAVMPPVIKYAIKSKPDKMFKKDGTHTKAALDWFKLLEENDLPLFHEDDVRVVKSVEPANPNSSEQVKDWLFSMGWGPCTFDYKKNDDGSDRLVPQVRKDSELAPSVRLLVEEFPGVELLEGLTVIQHRKSIFEGLLESEVDGYVKAEINGLTNTLRFKHKKPLVNLPGVGRAWGKEIRGALIADDGEVLCGADVSSLEDTTKRHYMYPLDPDYVDEMREEGYDPHLKLLVIANKITQDDYTFYVEYKKSEVGDAARFKALDKLRKKAKGTNYSALYGVGKAKLARSSGMTEAEAEQLLKTFWRMNWAIQEVAKTAERKVVAGQMWVKNPVNGFWYTLRYEKDIWSTLNQGTGSYCFDLWVAYYLILGGNICFQAHDELVARIPKGATIQTEQSLRRAMEKVNQKLKLNVPLDISVQFGDTYAHIH
jgi:hypothetical protein